MHASYNEPIGTKEGLPNGGQLAVRIDLPSPEHGASTSKSEAARGPPSPVKSANLHFSFLEIETAKASANRRLCLHPQTMLPPRRQISNQRERHVRLLP